MRFPEGENRNWALSGVARGWALKDPMAAAELGIRLPEGENRNKALQAAIQCWAVSDPAKARKWLEESSLSQEKKDKLVEELERIASTYGRGR